MSRLNYGKHVTNTSSWALENTITKHGVGIMLNKRWRKRITDIEYINKRAITTTVLVNRQHVKLRSVYFPHSKYADHHIEKVYKTIEKHMLIKKSIPIIGGDFNVELGLCKGTECKSVGKYTLNESNKCKHYTSKYRKKATETLR